MVEGRCFTVSFVQADPTFCLTGAFIGFRGLDFGIQLLNEVEVECLVFILFIAAACRVFHSKMNQINPVISTSSITYNSI